MHLLAYCYHWDRNTLWNLPKLEREMWAELVQEQLKAEKEAVSGSGKSPSNDYKEAKDFY